MKIKGRFTLHKRRPNLDNPRPRPAILSPQAAQKRVERRLGSRVRRHRDGGDGGEQGAGDDEGRGERLLQQVWQELDRQVDEAREVGAHLGVEGVQVDLAGPREADLVLRARVEEDAV
jgi:hypothetical protein